jgi:hypothetical protein
MDADGTFRVRMYELPKIEQTAIVKANVSVIKNDSSVIESLFKTIEVWLRPAKVGDLVYYDGTYGDADKYNGEKTVIGRCFYVAPRKSDGTINENFHNPNDRMVRLMVSTDIIPSPLIPSSYDRWSWGPFYVQGTSNINNAIYETLADGTFTSLKIDDKDIATINYTYFKTPGSNPLTISDGSRTNIISKDSMLDYSDEGLSNDGFKPYPASWSTGDGFAYQESKHLLNERMLDDSIIRLAGNGYVKNDIVNSGYARTLRIIAHRNNILTKGLEQIGLEPYTEHCRIPSGDDEFTDLQICINNIRSWAKSSDGLSDQYPNRWDQIYYPVISACYAYEPTSLLKVGEILLDRFKKHNWFVPTAGHMCRLVYYMIVLPNSESPLGELSYQGRKIFSNLSLTSTWHCCTPCEGHRAWYIYENTKVLNRDTFYQHVVRAVCAF